MFVGSEVALAGHVDGGRLLGDPHAPQPVAPLDQGRRRRMPRLALLSWACLTTANEARHGMAHLEVQN